MTINQELVKIILFQVGESTFKPSIPSHVVIGCKLSFFWNQVALMLKSIKWNELNGHPKDQGKDDSNSRMNSFKPGETNT